jgi:CRP-like cAMP-binding protein
MTVAPAPVASYLLDLAERHGVATRIDLPMSRRAMADYLGLSVEDVAS